MKVESLNLDHSRSGSMNSNFIAFFRSKTSNHNIAQKCKNTKFIMLCRSMVTCLILDFRSLSDKSEGHFLHTTVLAEHQGHVAETERL